MNSIDLVSFGGGSVTVQVLNSALRVTVALSALEGALARELAACLEDAEASQADWACMDLTGLGTLTLGQVSWLRSLALLPESRALPAPSAVAQLVSLSQPLANLPPEVR